MNTKQWIRKVVDDARDETLPSSEDSGETTWSYLIREDETGLAVRRAATDDAQTLAAIGVRAYSYAHADAVHPSDLAKDVVERFDIRRLRRELKNKRHAFLVAVWGGNPVGFAELRSGLAPHPVRSHGSVEIAGLYVAPDWLGYGVGRALLKGSLKLSQMQGRQTLWVRSWVGNASALSFFTHAGFEQVGREILTIGNKSTADVVLLSRQVESSAKPGMKTGDCP